jgi:uncharacterized protein DUF5067
VALPLGGLKPWTVTGPWRGGAPGFEWPQVGYDRAKRSRDRRRAEESPLTDQEPPVRPTAPRNPKADAKAAKAYAKAERPWYKKKRWIFSLGLIALIIIVSAVSGGGGGSSDNSAAKGGNSSQTISPSKGNGADDSPSEDAPAFKNGVLTTPDVKVKITRYKVIGKGKKGNEYGDKPVIAFYFKVTNLSGKKVDPNIAFIGSFNAYQDTDPNADNELEVGSLPDDRFLESQSENIKKGGTVESAMAYELDDLSTPVDLVATEGLDEEIGRATYELK